MSQLTRMYGFETACETVSVDAWETRTGNGRGLDSDAREQTGKSALDAANDAYQEGASDETWLAATVAVLRGETRA